MKQRPGRRKQKRSRRSEAARAIYHNPARVTAKDLNKYAGKNDISLFTALMLTLRGHQRKQNA